MINFSCQAGWTIAVFIYLETEESPGTASAAISDQLTAASFNNTKKPAAGSRKLVAALVAVIANGDGV